MRLRVWTFKNSLVQAGPVYAPWVLFLIAASVYYQTKGLRLEARRQAELAEPEEGNPEA